MLSLQLTSSIVVKKKRALQSRSHPSRARRILSYGWTPQQRSTRGVLGQRAMVARRFVVRQSPAAGASGEGDAEEEHEVEYDTEHGIDVLRLQIFSLTSVPPDIQKVRFSPPPPPNPNSHLHSTHRDPAAAASAPLYVLTLCALADRGGGGWVSGGRRHRPGVPLRPPARRGHRRGGGGGRGSGGHGGGQGAGEVRRGAREDASGASSLVSPIAALLRFCWIGCNVHCTTLPAIGGRFAFVTRCIVQH